MTNFHNQDNEAIILNSIYYAVIADANAPTCHRGREHFAARRPRVGRQLIQFLTEATLQFLVPQISQETARCLR